MWGCRGIHPPARRGFFESKMFRLMLVRFNRDTGEFEDQEFNRFCREHSVVRIEKEFINSGEDIYYSFFIEYHERRERAGRPDLDSLSELEKEQYERLRDWRNELAASEGFPAYIIMYNSQLFEIVKKQPRSISDFAAIRGMKGKAEKYGEKIIRILQEVGIEHEE